MPSNLATGATTGADWWNDSCNTKELTEAVSKGAVGSTSNPVILVAALKGEADKWIPEVSSLCFFAWCLIERHRISSDSNPKMQ